jgi:RNA polymerase sigma-70 factor (ECF subfamily)
MDRNQPDAAEAERDALAACIEAIAAHQDRAAFARLFSHFAPRLKAYLMRTGSDPGRAEELVQEAMLTVWRKAATFDRSQASAVTWLFTIARNRRIDVIRRERRPEVDPTDPALVNPPPPSAEEAMGTEQRDFRLRAAIRELPVEQADLLQQAFYQGLSHSEIAEARGLPLGTVKSRLRLAFTRLRKAMAEHI